MERRAFLGSGGAASLGLLAGCRRRGAAAEAGGAPERKLAGMTLEELRKRYHGELFDVTLPFWARHGVDAEHGGLMHGLDYDGTPAHSDKLLWFQGRAIWIYSFLYNFFGRQSEHLAIARAARDFVLRHARQPDGWWAELLARDGRVLRPFSGDVYGMYFVAEGLQEYAWAASDEESLEMARALLRKLRAHHGDPHVRLAGTPGEGVRPQGLWMVNLRIATQMLPRWPGPELEAIAAEAVDAVIHRHYNPAIGLNNENLNHDFSRPAGEENKSLLGHSIETLWMVMDEALRIHDQTLWDLCAARILRHIEAGWDYVYGGLSHWINVDQGGYEWPLEQPVGTNLEFRFRGEFQYMKTLWSLNEILVACMNVRERTGAEWAGRFFDLAQSTIDEKFSRRRQGQPGFMLFADRRMTPQEHVARQDNYHPPRQLMLNLLALDRMLAPRAAGPGEPA